ncbi:uncharacterized protein LOC109842513 [Asparagus officinalis]|uniref:uncharacterized protein LOC109842513 n=1 Tax=Asparagus officinalis TaxID=4686 RepID=UPI00098E5380|nr:uncharacterized protein LOC109842513 [Asparagus officinalis]
MLSSLVDSTRSAFQEGQSSLDSIVLGHEMIHYCLSKKIETYILKIGFMKSFDRVSWNFILSLLKARGRLEVLVLYGAKWIEHILALSKSSVIVNDYLTNTFDCYRCLKQDDPLSPMCFILAADILNRMLISSVNSGDLAELHLKRRLNDIWSLQFADDTLIFCRADHQNVSTLESILYLFNDVSGIAINYIKSNLSYSWKHFDRGASLAIIMNCSLSSPFKYLVLPLKNDPLLSKTSSLSSTPSIGNYYCGKPNAYLLVGELSF